LFFDYGWDFILNRDNGVKITHVPVTKSTKTNDVEQVHAVVEKNKTFRIQQDSDGQECPNCFKMYIMYY